MEEWRTPITAAAVRFLESQCTTDLFSEGTEDKGAVVLEALLGFEVSRPAASGHASGRALATRQGGGGWGSPGRAPPPPTLQLAGSRGRWPAVPPDFVRALLKADPAVCEGCASLLVEPFGAYRLDRLFRGDAFADQVR